MLGVVPQSRKLNLIFRQSLKRLVGVFLITVIAFKENSSMCLHCFIMNE